MAVLHVMGWEIGLLDMAPFFRRNPGPARERAKCRLQRVGMRCSIGANLTCCTAAGSSGLNRSGQRDKARNQ